MKIEASFNIPHPLALVHGCILDSSTHIVFFYQPIWLGYNSRVGSRHTVCRSKEGWQTFSQLWLDGEPPQSDMWILVHSPTSTKHTQDVHMMGIITLEDVIEKLIQVDSWDCWLVTGGAMTWDFSEEVFFVRSLSGERAKLLKPPSKKHSFSECKRCNARKKSSGPMTFLVRKHPFLVSWFLFFWFLPARKTLKTKATPWREHAHSEVPTPWRCPGSSFAVHGSWWHSMDHQKTPGAQFRVVVKVARPKWKPVGLERWVNFSDSECWFLASWSLMIWNKHGNHVKTSMVSRENLCI